MKLDQKKITVLSLIAVVFSAVLVNEFVLKNNLSDRDRGLASFGERNEPGQIKWEQELAKSVSQDREGTAMTSKRPTQVDRLMFEMLEGKYEAELNKGIVSRLMIQPNQVPVVMNTDFFIKNYGSVLRAFDHYKIARIDSNHESIVLKNKSGQDIGQFIIERDAANRVIAIDVK